MSHLDSVFFYVHIKITKQSDIHTPNGSTVTAWADGNIDTHTNRINSITLTIDVGGNNF